MGDVTMIEIIDFDFEKILGLSSASWKLSLKNGSVQPPKKRRKLFSALAVDSLDYTEVNEQIANTFQPNRAEGAGSNNGSGSRNGDNDLAFPLVTLAERSIDLSDSFPISEDILVGIEDEDSGFTATGGKSYEFTTDDIKVQFPVLDSPLIVVKNKTKYGLKRTDLLLSVNVLELNWKLVQKEIQLARELPINRRPENLFITGPLLTVSFHAVTLEVSVRLYYKIDILQLIFVPNTLDLIGNINGLLRDLGMKSIPTLFDKSLQCHAECSTTDPITPQLFYTCVSNYTASLPLVEKHYDIPELETQLMRFQRKTLKWLLEREGMVYDSSSNRCVPVEIISSELKRRLENARKNCSSAEQMAELDADVHMILAKISFGWNLVLLDGGEYWYNSYTANICTRETLHRILLDTYYGANMGDTFPAKGLLAEEMGLGKTVEITTLVILNQRPVEDINKPIEISLKPYGDLKSIPKSRTTLIISPESILKQWVEEIVHLAPTLAVTVYQGLDKYPKLNKNANLIAEYLSGFDVVFTTYSTISKELDYANYSSTKKKTRLNRSTKKWGEDGKEIIEEKDNSDSEVEIIAESDNLLKEYQSLFQLTLVLKKPTIANERSSENQKETDYEKALQDEIQLAIKHNKTLPYTYRMNDHRDYQTPLMLMQFWRVVLDEVQMVSSRMSRAFQSASLIPRHHAWGVSGTPIKKDFGDLHSVLRFLKYQPFSEGYYAKHTWEMLTNTNKKRNNNEGNQDFVRLWSQITLRHTKLMVHDDIKLPPQNRILLSIPFNPVEQENYNQLFEEFLAAICLDQYGNPVMDDWEPTPFILTHMRHSLTRLRQVCCNPQVGRLNFGSRRYKSRNHLFYGRGGQAGVTAVLQLKTLENVLDEMLSKASDLISDSEKEKAQLFLDVAEFLEYLYLPEIALETLNIGVWETERIIYRLSKYLDKLMNEYKIMKKFQKENGGEGDSEEADDDEDDELSDEEGKTNSVVHSVKNEKNENLVKLEDKITTTRLRLRSWNVMLHKFYFLIASSHFQQYDEEFQQKIEVDGKYAPILASVPGLDEFKQDLDKIHTSKDNLSPLLCGISTADLLPINSLTGFDGNSSISPHEFQEKFYYNLAERVREKILESSIKAVLNAVKHKITARSIYEPDKNKFLDNGDYHLHKNSKKLFKYLPLIDINSLEDNYIIGMRSKLFFTKVQKLIDQLNNQSKLINEWMDELIKLLSKPLLSHDKDPNGAEYEESIDDQDKVSCFLHVLSQIIIDRSEFIVGSDSKSIANNNITNTNNNKRAQQDALTEELLSNVNNKEFLLALQDSRKSVKPQLNTSLQELALNASNLESDLMQSQREEEEIENNVGRLEFDLFQQFTIRIRKIFENQKLSEVLIQKELSSNCNAVFNSRIEYFKQLQQISDSVRSVWQREYPVDLTSARELFVSILEKYAKTNQEINQKMTKSIAKFRYLQSLVRPEDSPKSADDEDDLMCTICRSLITIGSLTQCGHKYCKECLEHWLQNSRSCPMCKTLITEHSVYNFTHHKPNLKANTVHEKDDDSLHGDKADKLHVIYKSLDEGIIENIQEIEMKTSYSTKVDMIIKQVLYLKMQEPGVQIVIFSQWQDLLYIIGTALKNVNVSFLASHGTLTPEIGGGRRRNKYDSVEQFKKQDLGITCFLLNAKAQASGLTLINATHIFLCEPLVNTSLELQAISRIHRIGQTKLTTVWMFAIENTVEESIVLMSTNKRLQYFEQKKSTSTKKDSNTAASKAAADRDLSKAESITMLNSGGIDTLVSKGQSEGESVTNGDLWNAFFSASSTKPVTAFSNLK